MLFLTSVRSPPSVIRVVLVVLAVVPSRPVVLVRVSIPLGLKALIQCGKPRPNLPLVTLLAFIIVKQWCVLLRSFVTWSTLVVVLRRRPTLWLVVSPTLRLCVLCLLRNPRSLPIVCVIRPLCVPTVLMSAPCVMLNPVPGASSVVPSVFPLLCFVVVTLVLTWLILVPNGVNGRKHGRLGATVLPMVRIPRLSVLSAVSLVPSWVSGLSIGLQVLLTLVSWSLWLRLILWTSRVLRIGISRWVVVRLLKVRYGISMCTRLEGCSRPRGPFPRKRCDV